MTTRIFEIPDFYTCAKCKVTKPIDEFYICSATKTKHRSRCKLCSSDDARAPEKESHQLPAAKRNFRIAIDEIAPGHRVVRFGDLYRPQDEARHSQTEIAGIASSLGRADLGCGFSYPKGRSSNDRY